MIKKFNQFIKESNFPTSKEEIDLLCKKFNIKNYSINSDLSIDVQGNVDLSGLNLKSLPLKFYRVAGYFSCSLNHLTTLKGGPNEVGGHFYCFSNHLTTLEGGPREVGGYFSCSYNHLTTLEGGPREVGGGFDCSNNPVYEIVNIFPDRKMVLKFWDDFGPVRGNIVFDHRLREMYLDITNTDFKGVFKFKNYEINYD